MPLPAAPLRTVRRRELGPGSAGSQAGRQWEAHRAGALEAAFAGLAECQYLFRATGAAQAGFATWDGELQLLREDVGRHLDKLVGALSRDSRQGASGFALVTSRARLDGAQDRRRRRGDACRLVCADGAGDPRGGAIRRYADPIRRSPEAPDLYPS